MQTRERAHCARSVFPFIKKKKSKIVPPSQTSKSVKKSRIKRMFVFLVANALSYALLWSEIAGDIFKDIQL